MADDILEGMINEAPGPINFTMFLTMFGEKLTGTDPEDVIRNAFGCFDEHGTGIAPISLLGFDVFLLVTLPKVEPSADLLIEIFSGTSAMFIVCDEVK